MTISFECEHCRKEVQAPDEAAGKRGKCPFCGHSNYIPAPVTDEDELDLAPIDEAEERRRQEELRRLREQEKAILDEDKKKPVPLDEKETVTSDDVQHFVVNYCLDMYGSRLDRLRTHLAGLRKYKAAGIQAVEDFLTGKITEPALKNIPERTLKAFLMQLKDELKRLL